jgi:hypothetical protein
MARIPVPIARSRNVVGWSSLVAGTVLLASLFNAAVTSGSGGVDQARPTRVLPSDTTAALADGDDVRAGQLALHAAYEYSDMFVGSSLRKRQP